MYPTLKRKLEMGRKDGVVLPPRHQAPRVVGEMHQAPTLTMLLHLVGASQSPPLVGGRPKLKMAGKTLQPEQTRVVHLGVTARMTNPLPGIMGKRQNRVGVTLLAKDGLLKGQREATGGIRRSLDLEVGIATATAPVQDGARQDVVIQTTIGEEVEGLALLIKVVNQLDGENLGSQTIRTKAGVSQSNKVTPTQLGAKLQNPATSQSGEKARIAM